MTTDLECSTVISLTMSLTESVNRIAVPRLAAIVAVPAMACAAFAQEESGPRSRELMRHAAVATARGLKSAEADVAWKPGMPLYYPAGQQ